VQKKAPAKQESSDESDSDAEPAKKDQENTNKAATSEESSDSDSDAKKTKKPAKEEESSDSEPEKQNGVHSEEPKAKVVDTEQDENPAEGFAKKARVETNGEYEVFLSSCPEDVTDEAIYELFKECGTVTGIKWLMRDGVFSGRGFVKFDSEEALTKALGLDGSEVNGTAISVALPRNSAAKTSGSGGVSNTVFLGRISDAVTDDDIRTLFAECGEITGIRWGTKDGSFAGFGFCEFADPASVDKAVAFSGTELCGRPINIDVAAARTGGGGGGGRGGRGGGRGGGGRGGGGRGGGFGGRGGGGRGGRGGGGRGGFGGGRGGGTHTKF